MRSVLICGTGQIGTCAARSLSAMGAHIVALDVQPSLAFFQKYGPQNKPQVIIGDVLDQAFIETVIEDHSIDTIVLAIGLNSNGSTHSDDTFWRLTVGSCESIAGAALKTCGKRIIFLSSFAVYGEADAKCVNEETPLNPQTTYGRAKVAAETYLMQYGQHELDVRILRPCGIYGPRPTGMGSKSAALIDNLLGHAIEGTPLTIKAPKESADEYLYVKDVSHAIALLALLDDRSSDVVFNVGCGKKTTIPDIVSAVKQVIPVARFRLEEAPANGRSEIPPLDVSRIRKVYGFEPRYELTAGLADYLNEVSIPV